jgi:transposase
LGNYLKVDKKQQVIALLELGWSHRRIQSETGVHRETVSRYDHLRRPKPATVFPGSGEVSDAISEDIEGSSESNPAKVFPGSESKPAKVFSGSPAAQYSSAAIHHDEIVAKIEKQGLSAKRVWQDLVEDLGYAHSYESVKRYVRVLKPHRQWVGVLHCEPGEEGQVDFFRGAPTFDRQSGQWRRPWVFRMTLCCSRHGYEEAVWDQKLETFLRLHERAFLDFEGVPQIIRHDNLKSAVVRACLYDPDVNTTYLAFAEHWGFTPLPTRPRNPKENGKQERSGGYVKDNALKGRRFDSLDEQNQFLRRWNRTIARLRIHGTTRKQVWSHFLETDKLALQAPPQQRFAFFETGTRGVHPDAHVEVEGAFYPVPTTLLFKDVQVRWDEKFVRVYYGDDERERELVASHLRVAPGQFAPEPGKKPVTSSQKAYVAKLLGRCERVGASLRAWADAAYDQRGVRALRLIQGALSLTRKHPREAVLWAAEKARERELFRYQDLRRLIEHAQPSHPEQLPLLAEHPDIRPMEAYRLEDWS